MWNSIEICHQYAITDNSASFELAFAWTLFYDDPTEDDFSL